jgi:mycothiol system anti-sigma-R factor
MSVSSGRDVHAMEMDCRGTVERLYHFLDGELTEDVRIKIEVHLKGCPPCGDIVAFEAQLRRLIAAKCQERVPDELRERITEALLSARVDDSDGR